LADPHDAFFLGAQLARECAGLVCMLELARIYEKGDGIWRDLVLSYSWYMVLMNDYLSQDLRAAALNKPQFIAVTMENIAPVEAMARAWKQQSGIY
jgi:TPR repeat protein